jgi:hypothetical protein
MHAPAVPVLEGGALMAEAAVAGVEFDQWGVRDYLPLRIRVATVNQVVFVSLLRGATKVQPRHHSKL